MVMVLFVLDRLLAALPEVERHVLDFIKRLPMGPVAPLHPSVELRPPVWAAESRRTRRLLGKRANFPCIYPKNCIKSKTMKKSCGTSAGIVFIFSELDFLNFGTVLAY